MKIVFNVGVFGKHGIEHALVNLIKQIRRPGLELCLHQIYETDTPSPLLGDIEHLVHSDFSLPRSTFWGNIHMTRKQNTVNKLMDALGIFFIHNRIARHLNRNRSDVIVDYDLSLLRAVKKIHAPVIGVFHFRPKNFRSGNAAKLKRIGQRLANYAQLLVLCPEMLQEAVEVWPHLTGKFKVLPNSIDIDNILNKSLKQVALQGSHHTAPYFLTIARLTPQKNIPLLIESFNVSLKLGSQWNLIVIGDGEDKQALRQLIARLGLEDRVILLGYIQNPYPYIKHAGAYVSSSREEGFPVTLLEAMVLQCPIIALACPTGPADILENGRIGRLVPFTEKDPDALGQAMFEISSDSQSVHAYKSEMSKRKDLYSSETVANEFLNIIDAHSQDENIGG